MKSSQIYKQAAKIIPGGVNSPVRAFKSVGGNPVFIKRGKGAFIWDEEGKRYLDFCGSWGALLFGHAPESLLKTLAREMKNGTSFGIATKKEVELAQALQSFYPSMEMIRLVSSGTEAVMSAIRAARGFTGRDKIVKIDGGYHGHADSMLVKAGSGGATFGIPDSAGIPAGLARETLTVPFNDTRALENLFRKTGKNIALLALEPVPANMGVVPPAPGYLKFCRDLTKRYGTLLLFDEVITGFRLSEGGAQEVFGIKPDLTTLGKILGSGLPIAAFGGRTDIMKMLAPVGPVYQAGTLSGNPVAVSAALWVMKQLTGPGTHQARARWVPGPVSLLNKKSEVFYGLLRAEIRKNKIPARLNTAGSLWTLFFTAEAVTDYASAKNSDTRRFAAYFRHCLKQGIYLSPSQYEANFISSAHTEKDLRTALGVISKALKAVF